MAGQATTSAISNMSLTDLPLDIHNAIVQQLSRESSGILPPRSSARRQDSLSYLELYGDLIEKDPGATNTIALLNLSRTCSFFRRLLAPTIFQSVLVTSTYKNILSIGQLARTDNWAAVKHLTFCPFVEDESKLAGHVALAASMLLHDIMSQLPPNLEILTLDFTHAPIIAQIDPPTDQVGENWHSMTNTYLRAISKHRVRTGGSFHLNLYNPACLPTRVYTNKDFQNFLGQLTSVNINVCYSVADLDTPWTGGWAPAEWNRLGQRENLEHFANVKSFNLHGEVPSSSRPFFNTPILRPEPMSMPALNHIGLRRIILGHALIKFLEAHATSLTTVTLIDCYAPIDPPDMWTILFTTLAGETFTSLRDVTVDHVDIFNNAVANDIDTDLGELRLHSDADLAVPPTNLRQLQETLKNEQRKAVDRRRVLKLLPSCGLAYPPFLYLDKLLTGTRLREGEYNKAWSKLVDRLEENEREHGVLRDSQSSTMKYRRDDKGLPISYTAADVERLVGPCRY